MVLPVVADQFEASVEIIDCVVQGIGIRKLVGVLHRLFLGVFQAHAVDSFVLYVHQLGGNVGFSFAAHHVHDLGQCENASRGHHRNRRNPADDQRELGFLLSGRSLLLCITLGRLLGTVHAVAAELAEYGTALNLVAAVGAETELRLLTAARRRALLNRFLHRLLLPDRLFPAHRLLVNRLLRLIRLTLADRIFINFVSGCRLLVDSFLRGIQILLQNNRFIRIVVDPRPAFRAEQRSFLQFSHTILTLHLLLLQFHIH